jgi:hypothetical protein
VRCDLLVQIQADAENRTKTKQEIRRKNACDGA